MKINKTITILLIAIVASVSLTIMTAATLSANDQVPSSGNITTINVAVYNDQACTQKCTSIDWDTIAAGGSASKTVYIKNTGGVPITLSMNCTDWTPEAAAGPMTLGWNRENTALTAGQSISATISLNVSPIIDSSITNFSFNIIITGEQS
ncbi:MAG: hypothetical protein NWF01_03555 [Candidatus Bathyarchaeota archaeon]|nr:hypothetical protein [Candidatus Bathyarchaeota archaeon]